MVIKLTLVILVLEFEMNGGKTHLVFLQHGCDRMPLYNFEGSLNGEKSYLKAIARSIIIAVLFFLAVQ